MVSTWKPQLPPGSFPIYRALADALANDISSGRLKAGERLPTHRALARALDLNIGTVTHAYAEARARGLIDGEVGRGSFVRHPSARPDFAGREATDPTLRFELVNNIPVGGPDLAQCSRALSQLAARADLMECFERHSPAGIERHRSAGVRWIEASGVPARAEQVLVTGGAQHAMAVALVALTNAGDGVLAETLTYPGLRALAGLLRLRLDPVSMDEQGILPDALEAVCRHSRAKILYLMPNVHNPTGVILDEPRRREVVRIARKYELWIVEDDSHGFLAPDDGPPPIAALAPERTLFIASLSKSVCAGLRVAYLLAPQGTEQLAPRLLAAGNAIAWMGTPLMSELAALWIEDGSASRTARGKRAEMIERQALARAALSNPATPSAPSSSTLWLELPEPWRADDFVARCREQGVSISAPEMFAVQRSSIPHAVRLCICTPPTREALRSALELVAGVWHGERGVSRGVLLS
jgi:DNA-binding transcriptional MocR family regulator